MHASYIWQQYLRRYICRDFYTEPDPQQNPPERMMSELKDSMEKQYIDTGCDPKSWFRLVCHVSAVKNHTARESFKWRTPFEASAGETPDITGLLQFILWERVYYLDPPGGSENPGRWLGRAHNYGDTMCYWILTDDDTKELIVLKQTSTGTSTAIAWSSPGLLVYNTACTVLSQRQ
jgi:hypothetical protein